MWNDINVRHIISGARNKIIWDIYEKLSSCQITETELEGDIMLLDIPSGVVTWGAEEKKASNKKS